MKRIPQEKRLGPCPQAMEEVITFEKEDTDSINHRYPSEPIRNQFCKVPESEFNLEMMRDLRIKELPCCGDTKSPRCCFDIT
jgi:hypothetical protein